MEKITSELEIRGNIFDIQRYSLHDGPGIRTTVFLKGCPLRCLWCSNPESQKLYPELAFFENKCVRCNRCVEACCLGAITNSITLERLEINRDMCNGCGQCEEVCTYEALKIIGLSYSVKEVLNIVRRDVPFYSKSRGGVTLSGGEPLFQAEFSEVFLRACKRESIHTAVQTSAYCAKNVFERIMPFVDLFIFDLKIIDTDKHELLTGVKNDQIIKNLDYLLDSSCNVIIQIPLIPGVNYNHHLFKQMVDFLVPRSQKILGVSLIPYHKLGIPKYKALGRNYALSEINPPTPDELDSARNFLRSKGLNTIIFG